MDADRFDALLAFLAAAPSRRAALRAIGLVCLAGLTSSASARKRKKKKRCAKAGQTASVGRRNKNKKKGKNKQGKTCCAGLTPDANGVCTSPPSPPPPCVPRACSDNGCGDLEDGCGGTLRCGSCAGERICVSGVCQECTVICTASPAECGTVLGAAMSSGGTVYVCPGLYQGTNFGGPTGMTVIGAGEGDDPTRNTILDAAGAGRVLAVNSGAVEVERLRLTGGKATLGGGILVSPGATLRMTDCTISGNSAVGNGPGSGGGGIFTNGTATLEMTRCTVRDNHATGDLGRGGGILTNGTITLTDCLVEANSSALFGGGLYITFAATTLAGTTQVRANEAEHGGGIFLEAGTLTIADTCRVTENTAIDNGAGGGIFYGGGGVTLQGASPSPIVVDNCFENCAPTGAIPNCSTDPVSPCP